MAKAKEIAGLDCESKATEGIKLVLLSRFDEMCSQLVSAFDFSDIKGVHDMRVASRRARSALRDFSPFVDKNALKDFRDELKKIADALGAVRDRDVRLAALENLKEELGKQKEIKSGFEKLIEEQNSIRDKAREDLTEIITVETLSQLREKLHEALEKAVDGNAETVTFKEAANEIINARLSEFLKLGEKNIYTPFKVKRMHKLRISAKRLRYAMELFSICLGEEMHSLAKEISKLQDSLGEVHDCDVWIEDMAKRMTETEDENERQAVVWLLSHFVKTRTQHYQDALERWNKDKFSVSSM